MCTVWKSLSKMPSEVDQGYVAAFADNVGLHLLLKVPLVILINNFHLRLTTEISECTLCGIKRTSCVHLNVSCRLLAHMPDICLNSCR